MKIYLKESSVAMVGKSWEIRRKLMEYGKEYVTVADWIKNEKTASKITNKVILFPGNQIKLK